MLVALDEYGARVYADEVSKTDKYGNKNKYYCPDCGSELVLKQGTKNIWHFSHKDSSIVCKYRKGEGAESIAHQYMKKIIKEVIEEHNDCIISELEWQVGNRIADYYFEVRDRFGKVKKIAVECVHKHTNISEFRDKTVEYADNNVYVLWVFNLSKFFLNKDNSFKEEVSVKEILKEAHTMYFGKVYALDISNRVIYGIHLSKVYRNVESVSFVNMDSGEQVDVGGYSYALKSRRVPVPCLINEFKINSFKKSNEYDDFKYLNFPRFVANTYIPKWWD